MVEEKPEGIIQQVKESVSTVTQKISEVKDNLFDEEMIAEYKLMGTDAAAKVVKQLNDSKEIIKKSGYEFKEITIDIGIPPAIKVKFQYSKDITQEEREAVLEESKERKIITILLKGLFKANDLYHSVKVGNFKMNSVEIAIGLIPDISIFLASP